MITHKNFILALFIWLLLGAAPIALAQEASTLTLDQAVLNVQHETGGKVLSAESRQVGHRQEYRIKVLTPEGHVKVMAVSSHVNGHSRPTRSTRNAPARKAGQKEKR